MAGEADLVLHGPVRISFRGDSPPRTGNRATGSEAEWEITKTTGAGMVCWQSKRA